MKLAVLLLAVIVVNADLSQPTRRIHEILYLLEKIEGKALSAKEIESPLQSVDANLLEEWKQFKSNHEKEYDNEDEEEYRMKVFTENKRHIEEHNQLYEQGLTTYTLGMNQFGDMTDEEFLATLNNFEYEDRDFNYTATFIPPENLAIPRSLDWRLSGAVTMVKNQKTCGACWAFGATGALEGQHFRKTGELVSLSEQNLIDCTRTKRYKNYGCQGGNRDVAFQYIRNNRGLDTEISYQYEAVNKKCRFKRKSVGATDAGVYRLKSRNEWHLLKAVAANGPISVSIDARGLHFYQSGVFYSNKCSEKILNHSVLVVGYGTDAKGGAYWLVKNSWGINWGEQGYVRMARNRGNNCGIATRASYPIV